MMGEKISLEDCYDHETAFVQCRNCKRVWAATFPDTHDIENTDFECIYCGEFAAELIDTVDYGLPE
jgi:hypothetical protein